MHPILRTSLFAFAAMATAATAQTSPPVNPATDAPGPRAAATRPAAGNQAFLVKAVQADMAEVNAGALAERKGEKASIKAYGKMMVADHAAHRAKLLKLADDRGIKVPTPVNAEQKASFDNLALLQGVAFDTSYKSMMVAAHRQAIADYEAQRGNPDPQIAALVRETLPVLKKHLAEAQAL